MTYASLLKYIQSVPLKCYSSLEFVDYAGTNAHREMIINEPIKVRHRYANTTAERNHLWMHMARYNKDLHKSLLTYIPGHKRLRLKNLTYVCSNFFGFKF